MLFGTADQLLLFVYNAEWKSGVILQKSAQQKLPDRKRRPTRRNNAVWRVPKQRPGLLRRKDQLRECGIEHFVRAGSRSRIVHRYLRVLAERVAHPDFAGDVAIVAIAFQQQRPRRLGIPRITVARFPEQEGRSDKSVFEESFIPFRGRIVGSRLLQGRSAATYKCGHDRCAEGNRGTGRVRGVRRRVELIGALLVESLSENGKIQRLVVLSPCQSEFHSPIVQGNPVHGDICGSTRSL